MPETPQEKLKKMTAWSTEPVLTELEIDELLAQASLVDSAGLTPLDEQWTPTYDLNASAAAGWLIKAGRASELTEVDPPGSGIMTSQVFQNCLTLARIYRAKVRMSVSLR